MSTLFSNQNRELINQALRSNYNVLCYWGAEVLRPELLNTVREMVALTNADYNIDNVNFSGDTLDRHSWSCVGNLAELVVLMTLIRRHTQVGLNLTEFLRRYEDQVSSKADLQIARHTYQVKTATYGSGGQLFVAEEELSGTADYMAYVDNWDRRVICFNRGAFRKNMKTIMDVGGPYDRWYNQAGWFITPLECQFVDQYDIPIGVTTAYYNADEQQIYLSNGVRDA